VTVLGLLAAMTGAMAAVRWFYTSLKRSDSLSLMEKLTSICMFPCLLAPLAAIPAVLFGSMPGDSCHYMYILCMVVYLTAKAFVYLVFIEKAYIVNKGTYQGTRLRHQLYLANLFLLLALTLALAVIDLMPAHTPTPEQVAASGTPCVHGVGNMGIWFFVSFLDVIFCIYLTALFILPLCRSMNKFDQDPLLNRLVKRSIIASLLVLFGTTLNSVSLVINGYLRWDVCIGVCVLDVFIACIALNYSTGLNTRVLIQNSKYSSSISTEHMQVSP